MRTVFDNAFGSPGGKGRNACCTRAPSWLSTSLGTSVGSTQLPTDVPNDALSQPGARVHHASRARTPHAQPAASTRVRPHPRTHLDALETALPPRRPGRAPGAGPPRARPPPPGRRA
ncbi:DUF853 family protein, partial [Staphylococcus aureus]|nr:DUF853 family protein [Staphylococcus aureus]